MKYPLLTIKRGRKFLAKVNIVAVHSLLFYYKGRLGSRKFSCQSTKRGTWVKRVK